MDRFRIKALEKALTMDLSLHQRDLVRLEIVNKSRVLMNGFAKRGKTQEAYKYRKLVEEYSSSREKN
jgi:hypothetical protein